MGQLIWYVDACVFVRAQDAGVHLDLLAAASASGNARIAGTVRDELIGGPDAAPTQKQRAVGKAWTRHALPVVEIALGSAAATTFAALRRPGARDAGEAATVALVAHDPDSCFVTNEAGAAFLGLLELDRRVTLAPWWLRRLVDAGHLGSAVATRLVTHDPRRRLPTWWQ